MKSKSTFQSILLVFIIFLSSCDGNTDRIRIIKNNTTGEIKVTASGTSMSDFNKSILTGQSETLFIGGQMGGTDQVENPSFGISSMIITNATGDTCTKDYTVQENWEIKVEQTKKRPSNWKQEYTFIVNDSDF
jgi:hypothetical protein